MLLSEADLSSLTKVSKFPFLMQGIEQLKSQVLSAGLRDAVPLLQAPAES